MDSGDSSVLEDVIPPHTSRRGGGIIHCKQTPFTPLQRGWTTWHRQINWNRTCPWGSIANRLNGLNDETPTGWLGDMSDMATGDFTEKTHSEGTATVIIAAKLLLHHTTAVTKKHRDPAKPPKNTKPTEFRLRCNCTRRRKTHYCMVVQIIPYYYSEFYSQ